MEFAYLSDITGNPVYKQKVEKIREVVASLERPKKLYPNYLHPKTGKWGQQHTSVGALGDSFYEYLLKEWLRSGKRDLQVSWEHFLAFYGQGQRKVPKTGDYCRKSVLVQIFLLNTEPVSN